MLTEDAEETRLRALRRSQLLARIGVVAWSVVVVVAVVLVLLRTPSWPWVVVALFGVARLVLDARRLLVVRRLLAEEPV